MARLVRLDTDQAFELTHGVTTIGRRATNTIQLDDKQVSRGHCRIEGPRGGWTIYDSGSAAGTFVNARRIHEQPLEDGDRIQIGAAHFRFEIPKAQPPVPGARPLTDSVATRLLPRNRNGRLPHLPWVPSARVLAVLAAAAVAVALAVAIGIGRSTATRAESVVRQAAESLRTGDATALWALLSTAQRQRLGREGLRARVAAAPARFLEALGTLQVGSSRPAGADRLVVPVAIEMAGRRHAGQVTLCRQGGEWRVDALPPALMESPAPPPGPKSPGNEE